MISLSPKSKSNGTHLGFVVTATAARHRAIREPRELLSVAPDAAVFVVVPKAKRQVSSLEGSTTLPQAPPPGVLMTRVSLGFTANTFFSL